MKRNFVVALSLVVLLVAAACSTTNTTAAATGVVTAVEANSVTVSGADGQTTTYTLTPATHVYNTQGSKTSQSFLSNGQRVMVWSKGENAVRINVAS